MQLETRIQAVALTALLAASAPAAQSGVGGDPNDPGGGVDVPANEGRGLGSTLGPWTRTESVPFGTFAWWAWWQAMQEHYLHRRAHAHGELGEGDAGFFLGRGEQQQDAGDSRKVTAEDVEAEVLPLLSDLLENDTSSQVQAATLIAIARSSRALALEDRAPVVERILPYVADPTRDVSEAATVALGLTGHFDAVVALGDLILDGDAGQELVDDSEVPYRQRAYAAYGLGLAASDSANEDVRRYAVQKLSRGLEADDGRWGDLAVAGAIGIGMVALVDDGSGLPIDDEERDEDGALTSLQDQLVFLLDRVVDENAYRLLRAHAATAIGRLVYDLEPTRREALASQLVPPIAALLERGSDAPRELRWSAAIALGNLIDDDDDEASDLGRRTLTRSLEIHDDVLTGSFALMALARSAGRVGLGREQGVGAAEARTLLLSKLQRGKTVERTWSALSLGLHAYELRASGRQPPSEVRTALREALKRTESPEELSAYAIAVGLVGDTAAEERLARHVVRAQNDFLRERVCIALGMLGMESSQRAARAAFFELRDRPAALEAAAIGRALLDDLELIGDLELVLEEEGSLLGRVAMLLALGRAGDVRALDTLLAWARPRAASSELRAVAIAALGMLCEPDALPFPARVAWQGNPYALTETLGGSGRGILDAR